MPLGSISPRKVAGFARFYSLCMSICKRVENGAVRQGEGDVIDRGSTQRCTHQAMHSVEIGICVAEAVPANPD